MDALIEAMHRTNKGPLWLVVVAAVTEQGFWNFARAIDITVMAVTACSRRLGQSSYRERDLTTSPHGTLPKTEINP
jgi:hypothetical protein